MKINRIIAVTLLVASALMSACGGGQNVEVVVVDEFIPPDIPGVAPNALQSFMEGLRALNATPVEYETALGHFQNATEQDEEFWEAYENIGLIQLDLGRYPEAIAAFEAEQTVIDDLVLREWPVDPRPEILLNIGKAYALQGRYDQAAESFMALLEQDENNVEARANMAALHLTQGNMGEARQFISGLLEIAQNDVGALLVLASIYKQENDMQMASYLWEKSIGVISSTIENLQSEEQYEDLTEDEIFRLRVYNDGRIERLTRGLSDVQNELGLVESEAGNQDAAQSFFMRSVGNNPQNYAALANLGAIYLEYAFFEDACYQFSEALALRPRNEQALVGFAACTYGLGDIDAAYAAYQHVLDEYAANAFAALQLGNIAFSDLSDSNAALGWYDRNLEIRGTNRQSCDRTQDRACAAAQSIIDMRNQQNQN